MKTLKRIWHETWADIHLVELTECRYDRQSYEHHLSRRTYHLAQLKELK